MAVIFEITYIKNDGSSTELACTSESKHVIDEITSVGQNWGEPPQNWSRDGFTFQHWNTAADDSGTSYDDGDIYTGKSATLYAIWQADTPVGADVSVTLGNTEIASLSDTGSVTLATAGTYVNEDITIDYTKSGGGGGGGYEDVTDAYIQETYPDASNVLVLLNRSTGDLVITGYWYGGPTLGMYDGVIVRPELFGQCTLSVGRYNNYDNATLNSYGVVTMPSMNNKNDRLVFFRLTAQGGGSIY